MISENKKYALSQLKNISEINPKFIKLLCYYKNKNIIRVRFSENSYFLKIFNEISETKRKNYNILEIENKSMKIELEKEKKAKEKIEKENEIMKVELEKGKKRRKKK